MPEDDTLKKKIFGAKLSHFQKVRDVIEAKEKPATLLELQTLLEPWWKTPRYASLYFLMIVFHLFCIAWQATTSPSIPTLPITETASVATDVPPTVTTPTVTGTTPARVESSTCTKAFESLLAMDERCSELISQARDNRVVKLPFQALMESYNKFLIAQETARDMK